MAKKPKPGLLSFLANRNNLLIILIIVIIIAAALLLMNSEEEERVYDVQEINNSPEDFIGETITITAYYDSTFGMIHDEDTSQLQQSNFDPNKQMFVDLTAINETEVDELTDGNEYLFTGKVTEQSGNIVLEVTKIRRHR